MAMESDTAFAVIQRTLENFDADVGLARAAHAESEQTLAAVEYEIEQLKKLIAEHALPADAPVEAQPSALQEIAGENVGSGLLRLVRAA